MAIGADVSGIRVGAASATLRLGEIRVGAGCTAASARAGMSVGGSCAIAGWRVAAGNGFSGRVSNANVGSAAADIVIVSGWPTTVLRVIVGVTVDVVAASAAD